jgi:hypothetical protein
MKIGRRKTIGETVFHGSEAHSISSNLHSSKKSALPTLRKIC